jgi:hypothetical protein
MAERQSEPEDWIIQPRKNESSSEWRRTYISRNGGLPRAGLRNWTPHATIESAMSFGRPSKLPGFRPPSQYFRHWDTIVQSTYEIKARRQEAEEETVEAEGSFKLAFVSGLRRS